MADRACRIRRIHRAGASGQITIPSDIMRTLGLKIGDSVRLYLVGQVGCFQRFDEGGFTPGVIPVRVTAPAEASGE